MILFRPTKLPFFSAECRLRLFTSSILVWERRGTSGVVEDGAIEFGCAVETKTVAAMDCLPAERVVVGTVSAKETGRAVETVRIGGSEELAEIVGGKDADTTLETERFVGAGAIISTGLLASLKVPSILVAARELVELESCLGRWNRAW